MAVFLTVLRVLGITLLIVLSLTLLIILIILFVPFRYRLKGELDTGDGRYDLTLNVTWLLYVIRCKAWFKKNGDPDTEQGSGYWVKFFFRQVRPRKEEFQEYEPEDYGPPDYDLKVPDAYMAYDVPEIPGYEPYDRGGEDPGNGSPDTDEEEISIPLKLKDKLKDFAGFLRRIIKRARRIQNETGYKIRRFYGNIDHTIKRVRYYIELFRQDYSRDALELLLREFLRICRALKPRRYNVYLLYGLGDPALTGEITGVLSMIFLRTGNNVIFIPDFDGESIEGDFLFKGRICIFTLLVVLWNLYFNKDFRRFYRNIRK